MKLLPKGYSATISGDVMEVRGPGYVGWHDARGPIRRLKRRLFARAISAKIIKEFREKSIIAKLLEE